MSIDPVCNMRVDPETAVTTTREGITYHFCSEPCRARFAADPAHFVASSAHHGLEREAGQRQPRSSVPIIIMMALVAFAMVLLFAAPRTGIASALPYLLLLACPFLHLLFHREHRHDH